MRALTYAQAINEATVQAMRRNKNIFVIGEGADDATGIFGTTTAAYAEFGSARVWDTPIAENSITGVALGAAVMGMHPLVVHARVDFMLLAMDQIINHAAKWHYTYGGKMVAPLTMRAIIGRGWGQGPQHSQSLQSLFTHIPGLKVVMPTTPYDAKGTLLSSLEERCPVIFLEHRFLHKEIGDVPEDYYTVPLGRAKITKVGSQITIVGISLGALEAGRAAEILAVQGISAEVIDLISLRPWDQEIIFASVKKTGRLLIVDTDWLMCGMAGEIAATVVEENFSVLRAPIKRLGLAEAPTPTSSCLENVFYPSVNDIVEKAKALLDFKPATNQIGGVGADNKKNNNQESLVSIIVPALNEEENILPVVNNIIDNAPLDLSYEIIIINDGSSDHTGAIADELAVKNDRIKVLHHRTPQNVGACFRVGIASAGGNYVVLIPGDNETHPQTIKNIFASINTADIVTTYTVNKEVRSWARRAVSSLFTWLVNSLFGLRLKYFNGPALIKTELLKKIPLINSSPAYMADILVRLIKAGYNYTEIEMVIKPANNRVSRLFKLNQVKHVGKTIGKLIMDIHFRKKFLHE